MENQVVSNASPTINESSSIFDKSIMNFWILIGVLFLFVLVAIGLHLYWNSPPPATTTPPAVTPQPTSTISSPTELTNTAMNATHNENEYISSNSPFSDDTLNKSLDNAAKQSDANVPDAYSSVQSGNKSGWCYIGEERGYRSCIEVGNNDTCMSGDIFPSKDICINPSLRA